MACLQQSLASCTTNPIGLRRQTSPFHSIPAQPALHNSQCTRACGILSALRVKQTPTWQANPGRPRDLRAHALFPFDLAWNPNTVAASVAPQLFAFSLFPYLAFLYFLTTSGKTPKLALFGFWFLLVFVGATIPAGIYAKTHYGTALANVDWLHGSAESLLTITNLLIVVGLRQAIREEEAKKKQAMSSQSSEAVATGAQGSTSATETQRVK